MSERPKDKSAGYLTPVERFASAAVGASFALLGLVLVIRPPSIRQAIAVEQCEAVADCKAASDYVTNVSWQSEVLVVALLGLASIFIALAILGVRFHRIKVGDNEASSDLVEAVETTELQAREVTQQARSRAQTGDNVGEDQTGTDHTEPATLSDADVVGQISISLPDARPIRAWTEAPQWATGHVESYVETHDIFADKPASLLVASAWKEPGKGNRSWFFRIEALDHSFRLLRVGRGKGGFSSGEVPESERSRFHN